MNELNYSEEENTQETYSFNPILWGTIGYLFLLIFRPFEYWMWLGDLHIERVYMILLLISLVFWQGKRYISHKINYLLIFFFFVMILSTIFAFNSGKAWNQVWEQFKLLVLFFVIILSVRNKRDLRILVIGFVVVMGIYVGKSLWEFFIHGRHVYRMGIRRLIGIDQSFSDPNTFAATVIYSLPFVWALWKSEPTKRMKILLISYGLMAVSAIGLTGSRTGMLSFVFFLLLIWFRGKKKIIGVVGVALMIALSWYYLPDVYKERFRTLYDDSINESATESADSRWQHFKWGLQLYSMRPVLGWGPACSPYVVNKVLHSGEPIQLHNLTAQLLSELGSIGAIAFIMVLLSFYITQRRTVAISKYTYGTTDFIANLSVAAINTMWLLLFQGLSGHNLYRYTWVWIAAILVMNEYFTIYEQEQTSELEVAE